MSLMKVNHLQVTEQGGLDVTVTSTNFERMFSPHFRKFPLSVSEKNPVQENVAETIFAIVF